MNKKLKKENNVGATISRSEKGITLVALVITIVVLIILAGVSINAVMNGGLIDNAKDAKNKYEEEKQEEETEITDLEVQTDFLTKITIGQEKLNNGDATINAEEVVEHTPYLFKNGYLTGIKVDKNGSMNIEIETVESLRKKLPKGYEIYKVNGDSIEQEDTETRVSNGMIIKKEIEGEEKQVGRVIIFGELNCDGGFDGSDFDPIYNFSRGIEKYEEYQKVAMDVNHDERIDKYDAELLYNYSSKDDYEYVIKQNEYASSLKDLAIVNKNTVEKEYMAKILNFEAFKNSQYSIEWNEELVSYDLKGAIPSTTVQNILDVLPNDENIVIVDTSGKEVTDMSVVVEKDYAIGIKGVYYNSQEVVYIAYVVF